MIHLRSILALAATALAELRMVREPDRDIIAADATWDGCPCGCTDPPLEHETHIRCGNCSAITPIWDLCPCFNPTCSLCHPEHCSGDGCGHDLGPVA